MSERREYDRVPFTVPVNVVHDRRTLRGYWTQDVSEGGLRTEFLPVPIRSTVTVLVPLPDGEEDRHCFLEAEVMWRTFESAGIRFLDPPEHVLTCVRSVVRGVRAPPEPAPSLPA